MAPRQCWDLGQDVLYRTVAGTRCSYKSFFTLARYYSWAYQITERPLFTRAAEYPTWSVPEVVNTLPDPLQQINAAFYLGHCRNGQWVQLHHRGVILAEFSLRPGSNSPTRSITVFVVTLTMWTVICHYLKIYLETPPIVLWFSS